MDEARRLLVRGWMIKAEHDLATARKLAEEPEPLLDTAIYHCQQAAEKAVKGFLAWHDQAVPKTHDVRFLVNQAMAIEPRFEEWHEAAAVVTPYATAYRYPDEVLEPEAAEFEAARAAAAGLVSFVLSLLPAEMRPGAAGGESFPTERPGEAQASEEGSSEPE